MGRFTPRETCRLLNAAARPGETLSVICPSKSFPIANTSFPPVPRRSQSGYFVHTGPFRATALRYQGLIVGSYSSWTSRPVFPCRTENIRLLSSSCTTQWLPASVVETTVCGDRTIPFSFNALHSGSGISPPWFNCCASDRSRVKCTVFDGLTCSGGYCQ